MSTRGHKLTMTISASSFTLIASGAEMMLQSVLRARVPADLDGIGGVAGGEGGIEYHSSYESPVTERVAALRAEADRLEREYHTGDAT